jgi:flagellar protein FliJ
MKKFSFSLEGVKRYKDQNLDLKKLEYAAAVNAVAEQAAKVEGLKASFNSANAEFKEKNTKGTNAVELYNVKQYLLILQENIDSEIIEQAKLENEAERAKERMIEAKIESASIEKLRERRLEEYRMEAQKSEDAFIEEFVSSKIYRS